MTKKVVLITGFHIFIGLAICKKFLNDKETFIIGISIINIEA